MVGTGVIDIPPTRGGAVENVIYKLSKAIARQGHEVSIITAQKTVPHDPDVLFINLPLFRFFRKHPLFAAGAFMRTVGSRYDIFHTHLPASALLFSKFRRPVVYTSHTPFWAEPEKISKWEQRAIASVDAAIAISTFIQKKMKKYNNTVYYVPNGVDISAFKKRKGKMDNTLLFVGRVNPQKGLEYLVEALNKVRKEIPNVKLVCVGPKAANFDNTGMQYYNSLAKKIKEYKLEKNITFTGSLPRQEVLDWFSRADLFVLPSIGEGMALVLLEAMASGVPLLSTDVSGARDVITDDVGVVVNPKDPDALAEGILKLLSDKERLKKMSEYCIKRSKSFDWSNIAKRTIRVYEEVIS